MSQNPTESELPAPQPADELPAASQPPAATQTDEKHTSDAEPVASEPPPPAPQTGAPQKRGVVPPS